MSNRPKNWQDFERLCCDLWRSIWKDPNTQMHGRNGQKQYGVDIFTSPEYVNGPIGIQCKGRISWENSKNLTITELENEIDKAKSFTPKLKLFLIAYSGPSDSKLQKKASEITEKHRENELFSVQIFSWEDIWSFLLNNLDVFQIHYEYLVTSKDIREKLEYIDAKVEKVSEQLDQLAILVTKNSSLPEGVLTEEGKNVANRFLSVFEHHKISRPTIAEILANFSIKLIDLYTPNSLLSHINNELLTFIQDLFDVEKDWILSGGKCINRALTPERMWYKNPQSFVWRLLELKKKGKRCRVLFMRAKGSDFHKAYSKGDEHDKPENVMVVIEIRHLSNTGIEYITYEKWEYERWNYWRSRHYIKILIMFLEKLHKLNGAYWFIGLTLEQADFTKLTSCEFFPASILNKESFNPIWYPEDYVNDSYDLTRETEELGSVKKLYNQEKMDTYLEKFNHAYSP